MGYLRPATWRLEHRDEVQSTQDLARQLAEEGAPEGSGVVAAIQLAGRGRAGRTWTSPRGGLYMSLVLRPSTHPNPQLLSLVGAVSVVKGLQSSLGVSSSIRWPNDVIIRGRKVAGIIAEASYSGGALTYAILGIGLNCNSKVSTMEPSASGATSLLEELRRAVDIGKVQGAILGALQSVYTRWIEGADMIKETEGFMETVGMRVVVKSKSGEELTCEAVGLDESGALVVTDQGRRLLFNAEDVERLIELGPSVARSPSAGGIGRHAP